MKAVPNHRQPHGLESREVAALSVYYFLYFGAISFAVAFVPIFLRDRGLSLSQIALLSAMGAVAGALTQGPLGHLSDAIGSRRGLGAISCVLVGASYFLYPLAQGFLAFVPLYLWGGMAYLGGFTLPQAIISDWTSTTGSTARGFAVTRIWGTVGFVAGLLVVTVWPSVAGGSAFLYCTAWLYVASAIPLLMVREAPVRQARRGMLKDAWCVLMSGRAYVFLLCYTVFRTCESAVMVYLGLYLKEMGAGARTIANAYWINAVAEIPLVLLAGSVSDKRGRKPLLVLAFVIWPLRLYLYSLIAVPESVYYVQLLHGFTYGIMLVVSVAYMSDVAPPDLRGTAQGLLSVGSAVSMAAGPLLVGPMGDALGLAVTFRVMAGIMVAALIVVVLFVSEPKGSPV